MIKHLAGLGQACIGQPHLGLGCVIRSRHLLGFACRRRVLRGQLREAVVLLLGEREVRPGNVEAAACALLDGFVGNVDLEGDFLLSFARPASCRFSSASASSSLPCACSTWSW